MEISASQAALSEQGPVSMESLESTVSQETTSSSGQQVSSRLTNVSVNSGMVPEESTEATTYAPSNPPKSPPVTGGFGSARVRGDLDGD
jgi:hypothetical protein